jgi:hypothetical protein
VREEYDQDLRASDTRDGAVDEITQLESEKHVRQGSSAELRDLLATVYAA